MTADLIIKNANVFMTYRQCFEKRDVAVAGEKFYCVSPAIVYPGVKTIDAQGKYMIPGFIDIHMHIESSMTTPVEFSRTTLPYGVTTVVADAHEIANVFGMEGIKSFMSQKTEQDIFWAIPSSVPATNEELETPGAALYPEDAKKMASDSGVLCLGEIMNFKDLSADGYSKTREMIRLCKEEAPLMRIEGHCPGLSGEDLNRFIYEGVDADHTQQTPQSVLEKTDFGMFLELQLKSLRPEVVKVVCENQLYENVALVTDDTMADKLVKSQLNGIVKAAIEAGMPVEKAIYCATWTPARRMHLDDRGMIAPGKIADFALLESLKDMQPVMVFKKGCCVYEKGALEKGQADMQAEIQEQRSLSVGDFPEHFYHSVQCREAEKEDFQIKAEDPSAAFAEVNVIKISDFGTATTPVKKRLSIKNGNICWKEAGLSLAVVYERYGKNGNVAKALVEGTFKEPGAAATTWSHDSHNLLVMGNNEKIWNLPRNVERASGLCGVHAGGKLAAGHSSGRFCSDQPVSVLGKQLGQVRKAMEDLGYDNNNVIMSMSTLCLPVSPRLKLTDFGLLEVKSQEKVPLIQTYFDKNGMRI
ncbi:MAG: adenine deaminase C-terminal domain-containing protein [Clostridium sp.]